MSDRPRYQRVLVKVSGEGFCSPGGTGLVGEALTSLADEIAALPAMGVATGVVVGAGNLIRGRDLQGIPNVHRTTADTMGMLATVINALALRDELLSRGLPAHVMSARELPNVCEPFLRSRAIEWLDAGHVVIFAGGTGNPFFTTDSCASLRALEIGAEVLLKATKVDGIYDSDPVANPGAKRYERLTYQRALSERLGVMDLTAISMCMENDLPIVVFQLSKAGNLAAVVRGETVGTLVCPDEKE
jgi:uridylate kinase